MTAFSSALYFGTVMHRRLRPRHHRLRYRVFSMLCDIDELPILHRSCRLFSHNRFNLFSFYDTDHGNGAGTLRRYVDGVLADAGIMIENGPIRLLCSPRVLGYVFNPLSVYFCYRRDDELAAILYQVDNTFGQRHSYLIPVAAGSPPPIRQSCAKQLYVSPFLDMAMTYRFRIMPPAGQIALAISAEDTEGPLLHASFTGSRRAFGDRTLAMAWCRYPLLTLKVIVGIHWQALQLWCKGVGLKPRPSPPPIPVTVVPLPSD